MTRAAKGRDVARYAEYLHGQVQELLTGYGQVDYLLFDFSYPGMTWGGKGRDDWRSAELLALVRSLQPDVVVNDRLDLDDGDVVTPEQYQPAGPLAAGGRLWEACQTLNGGWMDAHARSIYGAGPAPYVPPPDTRYTRRGDRLYLHLFAWPFRHIHLPGLAGRVSFAQFLHDGSEIPASVIDPAQQAQNTTMSGLGADVLTLTLPVRRPDVAVPVVELFLEPER